VLTGGLLGEQQAGPARPWPCAQSCTLDRLRPPITHSRLLTNIPLPFTRPTPGRPKQAHSPVPAGIAPRRPGCLLLRTAVRQPRAGRHGVRAHRGHAVCQRAALQGLLQGQGGLLQVRACQQPAWPASCVCSHQDGIPAVGVHAS
jgi:hypothetical protein